MKTNSIPPAIAAAVATMTAPYIGDISAGDIQEMLCPHEQKDQLLTVYEVRDRLRVSTPTVHRMLDDGRLKRIKIGRSVRIPASSVDALINSPASGA
jgi:excisionase family DNA binding protein